MTDTLERPVDAQSGHGTARPARLFLPDRPETRRALNGIEIGLGFLLPWIAVAAVVLAVTWGVRRALRRGREAREG